MDYREGFHILSQQVTEIEAVDAHTHINSSHMAARGLHDVMLNHMVISELYAAGCPSGQRLSEDPDDDEALRIATKLLQETPVHLLRLNFSGP